MIRNYYKIVLFCIVAFLALQSKAQDPELPSSELPNDYGSPTIKISGSAFNLRKRWVVPVGTNGITEMGAWITPNAAGYTMLAAFLFELNGEALQVNYKKSLRNLIEFSYQKLPKSVGQLFKFTYNYSDLGATDVNSIRFTTMGVGSTPEESLAFGPIDQISQGYSENSVFPKRSVHYVWIYKNKDGSLTLSTIKDPFIINLKAKALKIKTEMLENSKTIPIPSDENVKKFDLATKWNNQVAKYKEEFERLNRYQDIQDLNVRLKETQDEFNKLQGEFSQALARNKGLSTMIHFLDVCQSVTTLLSKNRSSIQSNEKSIYSFEMTYTEKNLKELKIRIKGVSNDLNDTQNQLKKIFKDSNIPRPLL